VTYLGKIPFNVQYTHKNKGQEGKMGPVYGWTPMERVTLNGKEE
jgi:hypothetical protein